MNFAADHAAHDGFKGAVATHGDYGLVPVLNGSPGNRCGLVFWLGQGHIRLYAQILQTSQDELQVLRRFGGFSSAGIDDQLDTLGLSLF